MTIKIAVLGTGFMGGAIAELFLKEGYEVSVWNRTPSKADRLAALGAKVSLSARQLLQDNRTILVALTNYAVFKELVVGCEDLLVGRDIINLITGSPTDARSINEYFVSKGANYLDGAIEGYPADIGQKRTLINYAGPRRIWDAYSSDLLKAGGASRWVGEDVGYANVIDTAMAGGFGVSCVGAFIEAADYAKKSGLDINELAGCLDYFLESVRGEVKSVVSAVSSNDFTTDQAPIAVYVAAMKTWQKNMQDSGAPALVSSAHLKALEMAVEAGRGDRHIAATYE